MSKKILLINCAYRQNSITDQMINEFATHIKKSNHKFIMLNLREHELTDCVKCRVCTQNHEENPGECVNRDKMNDIVKKIEQCDAYVLASPAKFQATAKFFKCFIGRLTVYSYWPIGAKNPTPIKKELRKKAVLISVFPIPEILAKIYSKTINQLKNCANLIGAQTIDTIYIGMSPISSTRNLSNKEKLQAKKVSEKLIASL